MFQITQTFYYKSVINEAQIQGRCQHIEFPKLKTTASKNKNKTKTRYMWYPWLERR